MVVRARLLTALGSTLVARRELALETAASVRAGFVLRTSRRAYSAGNRGPTAPALETRAPCGAVSH
jgi:hypothetical protein